MIHSAILGASLALVILGLVRLLSVLPPARTSMQPRTRKPAFWPPGQGYRPEGRPSGPPPSPPPGGTAVRRPAWTRMVPITPEGSGPFRCGYCGRFGAPGSCEGCGAPNAPAKGQPLPPRQPDTIYQMVAAGILTPNEARQSLNLVVPAFDTVKR